MRVEILTPLRGLTIFAYAFPTAFAVGYILSPLRGSLWAIPFRLARAAFAGSVLIPELQTELNIACAACSDDGVGPGHVGRRSHEAEGVWNTQVIIEQDGRVGEVRVIQDVEELGAKLHAGALGGPPCLDQRKIPDMQAGPAKDVATGIAECTGSGRREHLLEGDGPIGRKVRDGARIADDVPAIAEFRRPAEIVSEVDGVIGRAGLESDDGVQLPAFEKL